jgi:hypothetical protein
MRGSQIFVLAAEVHISLGLAMLLPRQVKGNGWYGAYFASAGVYDIRKSRAVC